MRGTRVDQIKVIL